MRIAFRALLCLLALASAASARADEPSRILTAAQIQQLYAEVCTTPPDEHENGKAKTGVCHAPRDYPNTNVQLGDCFLLFKSAAGVFDIYYGRFSANRPQAIVMYEACEPHSNNFGGLALFDLIDGRFKFIAYNPGAVFDDCTVLPKDEAHDAAYCTGWHMGQGTVVESFGNLAFSAEGKAAFVTLFTAGNNDGAIGPTVSCDGRPPIAQHLGNVRYDASQRAVLLDVDIRDPKVVEAACDRFRRQDFDEEDRDRRSRNRSAMEVGLIHESEADAFVTKIVRVDLPDMTVQTDIRPFIQ